MDPSIETQVIKYVAGSSLLSKRALDVANRLQREKAASDAEAAPLRAKVLDRLTKVAALDAERRAEADRLLTKHAGAIELLGYALDQVEDLRNQLARVKSAELGRPEGEKRASDRRAPRYAGERTADSDYEASVAMARTLGLRIGG